MTRRTPQEKKALSYAKDRRNNYRANDKASRRLIPLQKARVNRAYRKAVNNILQTAVVSNDAREVEILADKTAAILKSGWMKYPDTPLGEVVETKLRRRRSHAERGKTALKRARQYVSDLKIKLEQAPDGWWIATAAGVKEVTVRCETPKDAVWACKRLMHAYFLESLGVHEVIGVDDHFGLSISKSFLT